MSDITPWDAVPLAGPLVGLAFPRSGDPPGEFAAAGGGRVVTVAVDRLGAFLDAHPRADFAVTLERLQEAAAGSEPATRAVRGAVAAGRVYDPGTLKDLVRQAGQPGVTRRRTLAAPLVLSGRAEAVRDDVERLLSQARAVVGRVGLGEELVARFGLLGVGTEARAAVAAHGPRPRLKLVEEKRARLTDALRSREAAAHATLLGNRVINRFKNSTGGESVLTDGIEALAKDPRISGVDAAFNAMTRLIAEHQMNARRLPISVPATPEGLRDADDLASAAPTLAALYELPTARDVRAWLDGTSSRGPALASSPMLRTARPNLEYVRRLVGSRSIATEDAGGRFLVVRLPGLEPLCLADWLARRFEDTGLTNFFETSTVADLRLSLATAASGLDGPQFAELLARSTSDRERYFGTADSALKYAPRGVPSETLVEWLVEYEWGVKPTRREVTGAVTELTRLAPCLPMYAAGDWEAIVARKLGTTVGELGDAIAKLGVEGRGTPAVELSWRLVNPRLFDGEHITGVCAGVASLLPGSPTDMQDRPQELASRLLASEYVTPTGRVVAQALPEHVFGTGHLRLADAARKEVAFALVEAGLAVAGVTADEVAAVAPAGWTGSFRAVERRARRALVGFSPQVQRVVAFSEHELW